MAKYCSKCGRALPEGIEICPMCHAEGNDSREAALFTQMTAETEIWKEAPKPPKKPLLRKPEAKERAMLYSLALVLLAVAAFVILYNQPGIKVRRAIEDGAYEKALAVYNEKILGQGTRAEAAIGKRLTEKAEELYLAYEKETCDADRAEQDFAAIYAFGLKPEGISAPYENFLNLRATRALQDEAEAMIRQSQHLAACDLLLTVLPDSPEYEQAQARAKECLDLYAQSVLQKAALYMGDREYTAALKALERGNDQLKEYDSFSAAIEDKVGECLLSYETYALAEAEKLAAKENYADAVTLIYACMKTVGETDKLQSAFDGYSSMAEGKTADDAIARATELYQNGDIAEAFLELEATGRRLDEREEIDTALASLERRFATETRGQAVKTLDNTRTNVDAALAIVQAAVDIRPLDDLIDYAAYLKSLRPVDLSKTDYAARSGEIFRSSTAFEALRGRTYQEGWIWGGNEASIRFELDGIYDTFTGTLAVRRDDGKAISGYFELWCDDEPVYTSEVMDHKAEPVEITCDISGCETLTLVFYCDYITSTAEDGFCYHGICTPRVERELGE